MKIDSAGWPFIVLAALPAAIAAWWAPLAVTLALLALPMAIALFFRDPERNSPSDDALVLAPADGSVMYAGPAKADEAPAGDWLQVTIFLSLADVHINRTPVGGRITRVLYHAGSFVAAYRKESHQNERSEIWIDHGGIPVVTRQVVGLLARRVVCRVKAGDQLTAGARIGLMKFGSRMDVFVPAASEMKAKAGDKTVAGVTVIAILRRPSK